MNPSNPELTEALTRLDFDKGDGLLPVIVQDVASAQVLMLGYMNSQALEKTLETGQVTFWSRSRQQLWTKGETSGHVLKLESLEVDCDHDTLLIQAVPHGPTCHLGTTTCFGNETPPTVGFLTRLEQIIEQRANAAEPDSSYTARLLSEGVQRCAQKVGEEGVEVALAAVSGDRASLHSESADLLYHLLVCLQAAGTDLNAVIEELQRRHR
jgi:phosphoribosyl-AMP cyclohydrolase / phosphoribosyl-ATP pyrophosphohydrolase